MREILAATWYRLPTPYDHMIVYKLQSLVGVSRQKREKVVNRPARSNMPLEQLRADTIKTPSRSSDGPRADTVTTLQPLSTVEGETC